MATFTSIIIDVDRPNVHAIAQSSGSGTAYMLAVVSAIANNTTTTTSANDHRIYKSTNAGTNWSLLENIISSGTGSDRLNYEGLDASSNSMFPSVAISATGQYQSIAGKGDKLIWYSMDYGATWTLTNASTATPWNSQTGYMFKYTGGAVPVLTGNTGTTVWASNHFTATTGKTAYILTNTNNAIYDSTNSNATNGKDYTYAMADLPNINNPASPNKVMVMNNGKVYSYIHTLWGYANAGYSVEITSKPSFIDNDYPRSSTINYCGGVALSADASYCAIARYTTTGGLWVIRNGDMTINDFSYIGNYNVNVVAVSRTGQYMVAGPNTSGTFYLSSDYGNNWTTKEFTFTGKLYNLFISDDGKRIVGAGGIAEGSNIFSTGGYIQYIAPETDPPSMTITSSTVANNATTNDASIQLIFTSSEATADFVVGHIDVINGALGALVTSDNIVYTTTLTPTGSGTAVVRAITVKVTADKFMDVTGNKNTTSNTFTWTYDNVRPSMAITSSTPGVTSGSTTNDSTIALTFTSTESTNNFAQQDIIVTNGALGNLDTSDNIVYTATFTPTGPGPCTIDVSGGVYTDEANNLNNLAPTFKWTFARTVSFDTNTLTITNSIAANATDPVIFVLPSGEPMFMLNVTAFTGTGSGTDKITYDLTTGGTSVSSGTFTGTGTNLLAANPLIASTNTTYILTLISNAAITYTIVGTKVVDYIIPVVPISGIHYTFDVDGTNSGSLGSSANITLGTTTIDTSIKYAGTGSLLSPEYTPSGAGVPQINYNTGTTGTTISFWARAKSGGSGNRFLYASLPSPPTNISISGVPEMNALLLRSSTQFIYYGKGTGNQYIDSSYSLYDDQWHHYAITSSGGTGTSRTISLYLDSNLLSSTLSTTGLANNTNHRIWLGGVQYGHSDGGPDRGLFGNIDDFRIYDSILNAAAINTIYVGPQSTPVSFVGNTLTIQNSIDSTDVDKVSFDVTAGSLLYSLTVTSLLNSNSISYVLAISGGSTISSGSFTQSGADLLNGETFEQSTNTTYILTLTCGGNNTYSIAGRRLAAGYTVGDEIAAGLIPYFGADPSSNRLKQSYVKDFIDISGSLLLRNNANLYVHGNTTVNGKLMLNNTNLQTDFSFNNRILVGSDISMNGNATIANDVSLNGSVLGCIFNNNSIPTNAFIGTVTAPSPDYTKASVIYPQKFRANGDVSMNGSTVQATNIIVNGNIEFNDGTKMTTYDDNVDSQSILSTNIETGNATTTSKPFSTPSTTNTSFNLSNGEVFGCCRISLDGQIAVIVRGDNAHWMGVSNLLFDDVGLYITRNGGTDWELKKMQDVSATIITSKMSLGGFSMSSDGIHMCLSVTTTSGNKPQTPYLFYSHNKGVDWTRIVNGSLGFNASTVIGMSAISDNGQYMYVTTYEQGGIIRSVDSGVNGTSVSTGGRIFPSTQIVCSRNGQKVLSRWQQDSNRQYTYSSNYGENYANINVNAPTDIQNICANADLTKIIIGHYNSDNITIFSGADLTVLSNWTYYAAFSTAFGTTFNSVVYRPDGRICASSDLRYIIIGCNSSTTQSIFSNNYGVTWSKLILPAARLTSSKYAMALSDSGKLIYVNSAKDGIVVMNISATKLFKPSTFSNLTIIGALRYGTLNSTSDYRIKNNVAKLDNTFTVDNLRPVKYFQTLLNKQQYGLIAHELQQYYPDLVLGEKDGHNLQSVNYTGLIAILINEIIRLKREFTELEK